MKNKFVQKINYNTEDLTPYIENNVPLAFAKALASRGITYDEWVKYDEDCFHNPFEMKNMEIAVGVIRDVIDFGGAVLIYGDYDADGLSAAALLSLFFCEVGVDNDVLIPSREDGYGLHADLVLSAFEKKWYDLIVTVDCGISNKEEVNKLKEQFGEDLDIIVTDHHEVPLEIPDCICVNPKLGYSFSYLSGSGVAFKVVEAVAGFEIAKKYADLAIIGTIADMMPLKDENRSLVKLGLANFNHNGLKKLAEASNCVKGIKSTDISMKVAPKINAAGRVGDPYAALNVLLCRDNCTKELIDRLIVLNEERKRLTEDTVVAAETMIDVSSTRDDKLVYLAGENWKQGILGIVANRFKENYNLPSCIMTRDGEHFVGSARATDGIDLHKLFTECADLLVKFGGHKASVGFTVSEQNLIKLKNRLVSQLKSCNFANTSKINQYDIDVDGSLLLKDIYDFSELLQPIFPNEALKLHMRGSVQAANLFGRDRNHLIVNMSNGLELKGFFNYAQYADYLKCATEIEVLFTLDIDSFSKRICGIISDIAITDSMHFDQMYRLTYLDNMCFDSDAVKYIDDKEVESILKQSSVLAVFDCYSQFKDVSKLFDFSDYCIEYFLQQRKTERCIIISPAKSFNYDVYNHVVVFGDCENIRRNYCSNAKYYFVPAEKSFWNNLKLDRNLCVKIYNVLKYKSNFDSVSICYDKYLTAVCEKEQFWAAIKCFEELGLIVIKSEYEIDFSYEKKANLTDSSAFRYFSK
ncbi:MAG: DHH family phosphoesterase [Corallococcus sp.]|nr:DHH family phosphoesterase [Corallococcus sp.]